MSGESPTGRGYTQGSDSYSAYDVERDIRERRERAAQKVRPKCTCRSSLYSLDIDLCPVHGIGCA